MAKDNEYPYKHKHIAIKHGHATFYGDAEPSEELLNALNKMAELAYEQCGWVKVDTGENNALLPDVSGSGDNHRCTADAKDRCDSDKCEECRHYR